MKIVHLTSVHAPFDIRIFRKQAISLKKAGNDVYYIASSVEPSNMIVDGVHVCIVKKSKKKLGRFFFTGFRVIRNAFHIPADIYHFHDPELIPWCLLLKLFGKKIIMDVHEDYPAYVHEIGWIPRPFKNVVSVVIRVLEKISAAAFDGVVTTDDALQKKFARLKPTGYVISANNYPIINAELRSLKIDKSKYEARKILFLGGVKKSRCAEAFIKALENLGDLYFDVYMGGNRNDEHILSSLRKSRAWERVTFLGRVPAKRAEILMVNSSVSINLFSNHPNNNGVRSNRLFEALAAGLPVIVSNFPEVTSFVEKHNCGIAVNPEDPEEISVAIRRLMLDPALCMRFGINGREAVLKYYNWESQSGKIYDLYKKIYR